MTRKQSKTTIAELKELLAQDKDFLRPMLAEIVQRVLESGMDEAVGAIGASLLEVPISKKASC